MAYEVSGNRDEIRLVAIRYIDGPLLDPQWRHHANMEIGEVHDTQMGERFRVNGRPQKATLAELRQSASPQ